MPGRKTTGMRDKPVAAMPVPGLYLLGTVLTSLFVTMGEAASFELYMQDGRIEKT